MGELGLWGITGAPAWYESVLPTAGEARVQPLGEGTGEGTAGEGGGMPSGDPFVYTLPPTGRSKARL